MKITDPQALYQAKAAAAQAAADLVSDDMLLGLGTGSTASLFIEKLASRCQQGLKVSAIATSEKSRIQAEQLGITIVDVNSISTLDMVVDGADEIDNQKRMIKGGGGALLREKIVASMSKEMVVIVDENKVVDRLGAFPLPVEVVPFGLKATLYHLQKRGYQGRLRQTSDESLYYTDNGNLIYDISLNTPYQNPERDQENIRRIPGIVETGFFFNLAGRVIIGYRDGRVEIRL
jgi:ribose 5-phosphate isomerase A